VREDEETEKNFSYSTDKFSCDGNSNDFDVDLNSDNQEGGLFHVKDRVIQSFNFPLPSHPMTTYSESEVKKVFEVDFTWESRDLLVTAAKFVGKLNGFSIRCDRNKIICNRGGTERKKNGNV